MKLSYIISAIEEYAPLSLQESWDNSGLQVALPPEADGECTGVLICLDVTPEIVEEAVDRGCNLIVSHHPLIFKGITSLAGRTVAERTVAMAVRKGVAVYSSHTALDSAHGGISYEMARKLGAEVVKVLSGANTRQVLLRATCPRKMAEDVRLVLLGGDTPSCDYFDIHGECPNSPEAPDFPDTVVKHEPLCRVEARIDASRAGSVLSSLRDMPHGDKVRLDIMPVDDRSEDFGLGVLARFDEPMSMVALATLIKERFHRPTLRVSRSYEPLEKVSRIALCGGSGGEFIGIAAASGAQAYITADVRYHDFADYAFCPMAIYDIGHFESESCAKDIFLHIIKNKFPNFAVYFSEKETNPVKYL